MINDYNVALMNALHSVFWYQGLLVPDGEERIELPDGEYLSIPKYSKDCVIVRLIDELKNKKQDDIEFYTLEDVCKLCEDFGTRKEFNVIWMMLVEMFGSCGTSPRTGWIEEREECAEFLQQVLEMNC